MADNQITVLTEEEAVRRIALLNTLEVVDDDSDGETLYHVDVEANEKTLAILQEIGVPQGEIDQLFSEGDGIGECIDISRIAFSEHVGAGWYDTSRGFLLEKPFYIEDESEDDAMRWLTVLNEHQINFGLSRDGISYHSEGDLRRARELAKQHGLESFVPAEIGQEG